MACGATKNGVICDNAGTTAHAGLHSGPKGLWGFTLRVYWRDSDYSTAVLKRPLPSVRARSNQGLIDGVSSVKLSPNGINLNTRAVLSTAWTRPTGWVLRSGFDDTDLDNDSIVIAGAGSVRAHARGDVTLSAFASASKRIVKNGNVIQTWADVENDHYADFAVVDGDKIWVEFATSGGFGVSYLEANSGTYIYTEVL